MLLFATVSEWTSHLWTAVILLAVAFLVFIAGRARDLIVASVLRVFRGRSRTRRISTAGAREIQARLSELRDRLEAFRVCVFQFHNGQQFHRSNHMWKLSLSHETAHTGVSPSNWREAHDLPMVAMLELVQPLIDDDTPGKGVRRIPTKDPKRRLAHFFVREMPMCVTQALANSAGAGHLFAANLLDQTSGDTMGFVVVQYTDLTHTDVVGVEGAMPHLCAAAEQIEFYLTTDFAAFVAKPGFWARILGG